MAAGVGQRVDLPAIADQQHRSVAGGDLAELSLEEFGLGKHRRPLLRAMLEEGVVDIDRLRERQVTTEVLAEDQDPESGKPEVLASAPGTAAPGDQRRQIQGQRGDIRGRMYGPDTPLPTNGRRPVVEAG